MAYQRARAKASRVGAAPIGFARRAEKLALPSHDRQKRTTESTRAGLARGSGGAARGGGPWLSIGVKILTVALIALVLMRAVTMLTVRMAASVNRELGVLGHGYIRSYAALPRANIRSLERGFLIWRLFVNAFNGEGRTSSDELRRRAQEADAGAIQELADARRFVREELSGGTGACATRWRCRASTRSWR